jgi:hypothetical protein
MIHNAQCLKKGETEFQQEGICDDLLASKTQCQTTENNVGAEGHKWQVKIRSIDIMARWLIFQAPSYLLCNPCPMTLMKEWKENHFELVLNILVIYLEIILHIMSCKIPAYLQKTQNSTPLAVSSTKTTAQMRNPKYLKKQYKAREPKCTNLIIPNLKISCARTVVNTAPPHTKS